MTKEDLLKLLNKYGFYSFRKEPFIYEGKDGIGFSYSFKDPFYGQLTRLFLPNSLVEAEEFLAKYYWYKKYGDTYSVFLVLDDYTSAHPNIRIEYQGKDMSLTDLNQLFIESKEKKEKDKAYLRKVKRTLLLLLEVLKEKLRLQNQTYHNLLKLTNNYIDKENEFQEKWARYQKKGFEPLKHVEAENFDFAVDYSLQDYENEIRRNEDIDSLEALVGSLVDMIYHLEIDEGYLQNKYELIKIPLQIQVLKRKIQVLDDYLSRKKALFGRKEDDLDQMILDVEQESTLQNIVSFEHYKSNEEKRIEEKYTVIPDLDIRTVGDFLVEFDNLKVSEPILVDAINENVSFEMVMENLERDYANLSREEQDRLLAYYYLLKQVDDQSLEHFISLLNNPNNIMMKIKYFKDIDCSSVEGCLRSIQDFFNRSSELMKPSTLIGSINVFWKDNSDGKLDKYLKTSSKRSLAPTQKTGKNDVLYIGHIGKGNLVCFIPNEIVEDIYNEDTLILSEKRPFILLPCENCIISDKISDIIRVVDFVPKKEDSDQITIVRDLIESKVMLFKQVNVERSQK